MSSSRQAQKTRTATKTTSSRVEQHTEAVNRPASSLKEPLYRATANPSTKYWRDNKWASVTLSRPHEQTMSSENVLRPNRIDMYAQRKRQTLRPRSKRASAVQRKRAAHSRNIRSPLHRHHVLFNSRLDRFFFSTLDNFLRTIAGMVCSLTRKQSITQTFPGVTGIYKP